MKSSVMHSSGRQTAGFTLAELAVGLSLSGIVALVIFQIFFSSQDALTNTRRVVENQSDARLALSLLVQDVRSAGADPQDSGIERVAHASGDTIRVQSDLNGDGVLDAMVEPAEDVTWYWDAGGETLRRRTGMGDMVVTRGVTFFGVSYLDAEGATLEDFPLDRDDRNAIRAIQFFLTIRVAPGAERERSVMVSLRNDARGV